MNRKDFIKVNDAHHFHELRRTCIGGSDAAAIVGMSQFATQFDVYASKRGLVPPDSNEDNETLYMGSMLEPVILDEFERLTGLQAERHLFGRHPDYPFIGANFDGIVFDGDTPIAVVEAKNVGSYNADKWGPNWSDEIPDQYNLQVQHAMFVAGVFKGYVIAFIGGNKRRIYEIHRNAEVVNELLSQYQAFWQRVKTGDTPEITGAESVSATLRRIYPVSTEGLVIQADMEINELIISYDRINKQMKELESLQNTVKNRLQSAMGPAEAIESPLGRVYWKSGSERAVVDYKAICSELNLSEELIAKYTKLSEPTRRFQFYPKKGA